MRKHGATSVDSSVTLDLISIFSQSFCEFETNYKQNKYILQFYDPLSSREPAIFKGGNPSACRARGNRFKTCRDSNSRSRSQPDQDLKTVNRYRILQIPPELVRNHFEV